MRDLISIIIPVFNEGENIEYAIRAVEKFVTQQFEILVIYDFPSDNTIPVVLKLKKNLKKIHLLRNIFGKGVVSAVRTGIKFSKGNYIVVMSPDFSDDPKTINKMYKKMKEGFDIVCATRYSDGGQRLEKPSLKLLLSKFVGLSTKILFRIQTTDLTNGFKMYRKEIFKIVQIQSNGGWEFSMEIVLKANNKGLMISEVPTISRKRVYGKSKFKLLTWLPSYLYWLVWGLGKRFSKVF